ncbi:MAG: RES family NAD+ phosphorylase [Nocardioidaceae bacterium]
MGAGKHRQQVFQRPPDPDLDYRRFPYQTFKAGTRWHRQHDAALGPWWFSCSMLGRFDLAEPDGTCYLADSPESAVRERVGPDIAQSRQVAASVLADRVVSTLALPAPVRAANLESNRAADRYGVTGELSTMTPYDVTQAWARALHQAGFGGVCGRLRFTVSRHRGLAIFGAAGSRPGWAADPSPVSLADVAGRMGIAIIDPPDDDQLTIITPPR